MSASTFEIDDGDNLNRPNDDNEMTNTFTLCTLTDSKIRAHGYCTQDDIHPYMSPCDQQWTNDQLRAKSRYGNFPPYYKFSGTTHGIAYFKITEVARWLYARYIVDRPDLVVAAEKAGFIRDGFIPTSGAPRPKTRKRQQPSHKPVTLPSRQWGTGQPPSRKKPTGGAL